MIQPEKTLTEMRILQTLETRRGAFTPGKLLAQICGVCQRDLRDATERLVTVHGAAIVTGKRGYKFAEDGAPDEILSAVRRLTLHGASEIEHARKLARTPEARRIIADALGQLNLGIGAS